jgi:hypothetical protein
MMSSTNDANPPPPPLLVSTFATGFSLLSADGRTFAVVGPLKPLVDPLSYSPTLQLCNTAAWALVSLLLLLLTRCRN